MRLYGAEGYASLDFATRQGTLIRPSEPLRRGEIDLDGLDMTQPAAVKERVFGTILRVEQVQTEGREPLALELEDFVQAARGHSRPRVGGDDALRAMRLADQILQSLNSHAWEGVRRRPHRPARAPRPGVRARPPSPRPDLLADPGGAAVVRPRRTPEPRDENHGPLKVEADARREPGFASAILRAAVTAHVLSGRSVKADSIQCDAAGLRNSLELLPLRDHALTPESIGTCVRWDHSRRCRKGTSMIQALASRRRFALGTALVVVGWVLIAAVGTASAAEPVASPSRLLPKKGLVAYLEYDGLDAHAAAWKASAAGEIFNDTPAGSMLAELARQLLVRVLKEEPGVKVNAADLLGLPDDLVRQGFALAALRPRRRRASRRWYSTVSGGRGRGRLDRVLQSLVVAQGEDAPRPEVPRKLRGRDLYPGLDKAPPRVKKDDDEALDAPEGAPKPEPKQAGLRPCPGGSRRMTSS